MVKFLQITESQEAKSHSWELNHWKYHGKYSNCYYHSIKIFIRHIIHIMSHMFAWWNSIDHTKILWIPIKLPDDFHPDDLLEVSYFLGVPPVIIHLNDWDFPWNKASSDQGGTPISIISSSPSDSDVRPPRICAGATSLWYRATVVLSKPMAQPLTKRPRHIIQMDMAPETRKKGKTIYTNYKRHFENFGGWQNSRRNMILAGVQNTCLSSFFLQ